MECVCEVIILICILKVEPSMAVINVQNASAIESHTFEV